MASVGTGPTELAAFDAALRGAGIADFNLITLSSVIPAGAQVVVTSPSDVVVDCEWGDRLYVVLAEHRTKTPGAEAWADIGWGVDPQSGRGLFVEHHGESEDEVRDISKSLRALFRGREIPAPEMDSAVIGATCRSEPVCALVAAVYNTESWK